MPPATESPRAVYELTDVCKSFEGQLVLSGIEFELYAGETLGIIGPSGSGKTVLLKCMVALIPIDRGRLRFEGQSVPDMDRDEQTRLRQRVGVVFQAGGLFDSMTVSANLSYGLEEQFFRTMNKKEREERVAWALDAVGLPQSEAYALPRDLSGGMRKRIGLARTIVTHPAVILYDAPTEGLDPPNAHLISDLIARLHDKLGVTSIVVSHDLRTVVTVCNRVGFLEEGQLTAPTASGHLAESEDERVRDFVTGHPPEEPFDPRESRPPEPWPKD